MNCVISLLLFKNFNIYKRLVEDLFAKPGLSDEDSYKVWADLRTMLHDLVSFLLLLVSSIIYFIVKILSILLVVSDV